MNTHRGQRSPGRRGGFTMLELMVVAAIFVLLIALAVPAFSNMLYSSEQSMAENSLRVGVLAARDAAARAPRGDDAAAAFFYDPASGYTIVPYIRAGVLHDLGPTTGNRPPVRIREVFVPVPGYEPVHLPRGWMIRGFAPPQSIDSEWYGDSGSAYDLPAIQDRGQWLFPETAFYLQNNDPMSAARGDDGAKRQTFILRFEGGTGMFLPVDNAEVLLLAPAPTQSFRNTGIFSTASWRADREADGIRFVRRILASTLTDVQKRQLLGDNATDTVLAKPVSEIALYNERALANVLARTVPGVRVDPSTRSLYLRFDRPAFVPQGGDANQMLNGRAGLSAWIENRVDQVDSDARIFAVHRYLGQIQEVSGTIWGAQ